MFKLKIIICLLIFVGAFQLQAYSQVKKQSVQDCKKVQKYDMRQDLTPHRLTIAMWDHSWLGMHHPGGAFEDFDKVTDELLERGFNTVRIDPFPLIIGKLDHPDQKITIKKMKSVTWDFTDEDREHDVVKELVSFMEIAKSKNIKVILSTWGKGCKEFEKIREYYTDKETFWKAWEKVLDILDDKGLLSHVLYVDLDQEFPYFSPFYNEIKRLGLKKVDENFSESKAMEEAGQAASEFRKLEWNTSQMRFVYDLLNSTLIHFQGKYPQLRFTFSLTGHWEEIRAMNIKTFDVLELHFWMSHDRRFINRTKFNTLVKTRGKYDYKDYMDRINKTMQSIRPMLLKEMHNQLEYGQEWSEEIAVPLVTTEAWGPWWHMDHPDLDWKFLYDWSEEGMKLASRYGLWGATPWNFSHPYWKNWENIDWYKKVNSRFIKDK